MLSDDEEPWISPSSTDRFTHADPRREALKKQIKAKTGREVSGKDLKALKQELSGAKVENKTKPVEDKVAKVSPRTKTNLEKEQDAVATAQDNPDMDEMIERQATATKVSEEEVQSEPG